MPLQAHNTNNKRPIAAMTQHHFGQQQPLHRRRRFQLSNAAVSPRDVLDPARRRFRVPEYCPPWRLGGINHNYNHDEARSGLKRSYIGALIYRPEGGSGELAVHVFDGYRVKIRRVELESRVVDRFSKKRPLTSHVSSNLFVVQKLVPVHYSAKTHFELDADGGFQERHEVTLNFERKFVTKLVSSFGPFARCFHSEAYLNVC
uniref:Uncharacterized protein n=1 Tax=Culex tarsalis TaxID=7177 RepID=A0A1Q3FVW4_CULTA